MTMTTTSYNAYVSNQENYKHLLNLLDQNDPKEIIDREPTSKSGRRVLDTTLKMLYKDMQDTTSSSTPSSRSSSPTSTSSRQITWSKETNQTELSTLFKQQVNN